jgi:outer membrane murein-binding lipoprotein Lpp
VCARYHRAAVFVLTTTLAGCGTLRKARECSLLIGTINESVQRLEGLELSDSRDIATVVKEARQLSSGYEELSHRVGAIRLKHREVRAAAADYQALAARAAGELSAVGQAVERLDTEAARAAKGRVAELERDEGALMARINALCGAK